MAGPTVTHTFANSTTADATQVNQNFTDLINGMTDGSKDFNINALTCAGAAVFNGAVTLGNASSDDLTITASLASSLAVKTDNSFDMGAAATALKDIYCYKVYTDALDDRGSSGITCTPRFMVDNTTDASNGTDGSLQTDGGLSVAKKAYIGTTLTVGTSIVLPSSGATASALNFYAESSDSISFAPNGVGSSSTGSVTRYFSRIGNIVTVKWAGVTNGDAAGTTTLLAASAALPTWARPSVRAVTPMLIYNNDFQSGICIIDTDGSLKIYRDPVGSTWTNGTDTAGTYDHSMSYVV
jgi:hypothetical protein